jgi:protein ImuB
MNKTGTYWTTAMAARRILSLWFPRLAAERMLRRWPLVLPAPFAVVGDRNGAQVLASLNAEAQAAGLSQGQPLRDAMAACAGLLTRAADPARDAQFLTVLRRWAGKFSPWVTEEAPDALMINIAGCAHLFGGEEGLLAEVAQDCADLGLTVRAAVADTPGAAWALARFAGQAVGSQRSGDAIDQEARATRSRAGKRRGWEKGVAPAGGGAVVGQISVGTIAPPGQLHRVLAGLPLAALRLSPDAVEGLARLGLRRVGDIATLPRAALARRFGVDTLQRLDQAMGRAPEPLAPTAVALHFATRLTFPDPIGLLADVEAGLDRLLPPLCARLQAAGRGARRVRLQAFCTDGRMEEVTVTLARAADEVARIRPLLGLKLDQINAGFGIDCLRLSAPQTESRAPLQHSGPGIGMGIAGRPGRHATAGDMGTGMADLIGKLGARLGDEHVQRLLPGESHLPEKAAIPFAAAWSAPPDAPWPAPRSPRPLVLFRPEPVTAPPDATPPATFRFRRRDMATRVATGPERIGPEWWLDDPDWRSGMRDYWRVETLCGARLWLYFAHGAEVSAGWFAQGEFA